MTFKEVCEYYPIDTAMSGSYYLEETFNVSKESLKKIKMQELLEWNVPYSYPFFIYNIYSNRLESWNFSAYPIKGYINTTNDPENFYPATYTDDYGWEKVDPFSDDISELIIMPDDELEDSLKAMGIKCNSAYEWMNEQIAFQFSPTLYNAGHIFTKYDQLEKFVENTESLN